MKRIWIPLIVLVGMPWLGQGGGTSNVAMAATPIQHVVVIIEENHAFNDVLGKYCVEQAQGLITRSGLNAGCIGTAVGKIHTGASFTLQREPDYGINVNHGTGSQSGNIDGGKMDGWDLSPGCKSTSQTPYGCLMQFDPLNGTCGTTGTSNCTPNIDNYANHFAISDHQFEFRAVPSWAGHMIFGDASLEHYTGRNPAGTDSTGSGGTIGWGCDSQKYAEWLQNATINLIPPCIPNSGGQIDPWYAANGYTGPIADHVPTIFDRMDSAGVSWKIYGGTNPTGDPNNATHGGYGWTICPDFWSCLGNSSQHSRLVQDGIILKDISNGVLPQVAYVTPDGGQSSHPPQSMNKGDAFVARTVAAVMNSPYWSSTAIFVTWDDCGCFYDPVNPLQYDKNWGIREPLLIVSPYAKAGFTDTTPSTPASILAYIEQNFGVTPLHPCATEDSFVTACTDDVLDWNGGPTYAFQNSFNYSQTPLPPSAAVHTRLPAKESAWVRAHPDLTGNLPT